MTSVDTPEDITAPLPPRELAASLAADKAVAARAEGAGRTILAFDTIVVLGRRVLGKPRDRADAVSMLVSLSGGTHEVVTGVAILGGYASLPRTFAISTPVTMRLLSGQDIEGWVAEDECLGCAGAYNIERHLASVADDQCFNNVAGMPLCHVYAALVAEGVELLTVPVRRCDRELARSCLLGPSVCAGARQWHPPS